MIEAGRDKKADVSRAAALVGRHPICDPRQHTIGYELLFRATATDNSAQVTDQESATAQVIVNSFLEIGLDDIVGSSLAFINVTRNFILSDYFRFIPKDRCVFEILEDTEPDEELLAAVGRLNGEGYRFALDDFAFEPARKVFLPYCSYVKVDLRLVNPGTLAEELHALNARNLGLLAEKVETFKEFEDCKNAGFQYFQGYFFCRPRILSGAKLPSNRLAMCELLSKLYQVDVSPSEIETLVSRDLTLSYRLLRYINSACVSLPRTVESISHAVRLVGIEFVRLLASMIMLASLDSKPRELLSTSLIRAKMCELIAKQMGLKRTDIAFTVGLFSTLDAFLDCSMEEALRVLPLSDTVKRALLTYDGEHGEVLRTVLLCQDDRLDIQDVPVLRREAIQKTFVDAVKWGKQLLQRFGSSTKAEPTLVNL